MVLAALGKALAGRAAGGAAAKGAASGGLRGAASKALAQRSATAGSAPGVNLRSGVVQPTPGQTAAGQVQAQQTRSRSQIMMEAATRQRAQGGRTVRTGGSSGRYWQGAGTEVVGGMPANYDRMSIAAPRTMDFSRAQKHTTDWMTNKIAGAIDSREMAHSNLVPRSEAVATWPRPPAGGTVGQPAATPTGPQTPGPLQAVAQPPAGGGRQGGIGPYGLARIRGELAQPAGGSPLYTNPVQANTPVSQGVRFMQPAGTSERGAQEGRSDNFTSGFVYGEPGSKSISTTSGTPPWNASMTGSQTFAPLTQPGTSESRNVNFHGTMTTADRADQYKQNLYNQKRARAGV